MIIIRLQRVGRKNAQHFRVVLAEKTTSPRGKAIETLGFVNPHTKERSFNKDRIIYWISKGAGLSDTVSNFLVTEKIIDAPKIAKHKKTKKEVKK
ncbi:30S ribosomal protein S16 [Candidatus Azambacteria bacterium RBG_16_47_10]|uniref:Small ribosomal subunit protein bS16 n=1 Tax=Candidatus Azambacteria bacterium RBG_16_47_10 TaxID=1797292 RepID=A0A1F5AYY7_9BACT|nr:MAG: 30S ribosomal protein S16 [Candidatus Azambacteria bacterium RBG_16_47_10]